LDIPSVAVDLALTVGQLVRSGLQNFGDDERPFPRRRELVPLGMKTVSEFFGIPEIDFEIFRSDSSVTVFFKNGIGFQNFLSESVSESAWCFTDRFLRLPIFVGNYRICVSEFSGILSRNVFSEFLSM
jgi:hypothetical protein